MSSWIKQTGAVAVLTALLVGCQEEPPPVEVTVTDSAGVRIVSSGAIENLRGPWQLSRRPVMQIGWKEDEPTFERLRSGGFADDGSIVVGDQMASKVWRISLDGEVQKEWGRRGEGPGELGYVSVVLPDGDSVFVQTEDGTISVFSEEGFARRFRSPERDRPLRGMTHDGALLFSPWQPGRPWEADGLSRKWIDGVVYRRPRVGGAPDTLLTYPLGLPWPSRRISDPFAPVGDFATTGDRLIVWRSDTPEVRWYDLDGNVRQIAQWQYEPRPVTDDDWESFAEAFNDLSSPEVQPNSGQRRVREVRPTASSEKPIFEDGMLVDGNGNVWFGKHIGFYREPERYFILGRDGRWIGSIDLPSGFKVLDVSSDYVLGIESDEWDVPAVSVYEIRR